MLGPLTPSHTHEVEEVTPPPSSALARSVAVARDKGWRLVLPVFRQLVLHDDGSSSASCGRKFVRSTAWCVVGSGTTSALQTRVLPFRGINEGVLPLLCHFLIKLTLHRLDSLSCRPFDNSLLIFF